MTADTLFRQWAPSHPLFQDRPAVTKNTPRWSGNGSGSYPSSGFDTAQSLSLLSLNDNSAEFVREFLLPNPLNLAVACCDLPATYTFLDIGVGLPFLCRTSIILNAKDPHSCMSLKIPKYRFFHTSKGALPSIGLCAVLCVHCGLNSFGPQLTWKMRNSQQKAASNIDYGTKTALGDGFALRKAWGVSLE